MKAIVISTINGEKIVIPLDDVQTVTFSDYEEDVIEDIKDEGEETIDDSTAETPIDAIVPEPPMPDKVEEEIAVEPVPDAVDTTPAIEEEVAPSVPADDPIAEIVDMVSEKIDVSGEDTLVAKADEPAEEVEIPDTPVEDEVPVEEMVAVATDTNGTIEVKPAEEPKKEESTPNATFTEF